MCREGPQATSALMRDTQEGLGRGRTPHSKAAAIRTGHLPCPSPFRGSLSHYRPPPPPPPSPLRFSSVIEQARNHGGPDIQTLPHLEPPVQQPSVLACQRWVWRCHEADSSPALTDHPSPRRPVFTAVLREKRRLRGTLSVVKSLGAASELSHGTWLAKL